MTSRARIYSAIALLLATASLGAQQADRAQTEALSQRAADRLTALHDEAEHLASEERTLLGDLRRLELTREIKTEEFRRAERETAAVTADLSVLDARIDVVTDQTQADLPGLRARLVSLYKLGQGRYTRLLLSAADVRQVGQASRMAAALAVQDRDRVAQHRQRLDELGRTRAALATKRLRLIALRTDAGRARDAATQAVIARNALISDIDHQRDLNAQFSGELLVAQQSLQTTLAGLASGVRNTPAATLPMAPFRGDLAWPVTGPVRQRFGAARGGATASNGIDIAVPEGTTVHATHEGTVAFAGPFTGFGQLVIVDHGGQTFSLYGNLEDLAVTAGTQVTRGDTLGAAGTAPTGATGLYFELRIDGHPTDPLQWLEKR
jgi:septal ring factor EnvC (AmiA/AmiB activator)